MSKNIQPSQGLSQYKLLLFRRSSWNWLLYSQNWTNNFSFKTSPNSSDGNCASSDGIDRRNWTSNETKRIYGQKSNFSDKKWSKSKVWNPIFVRAFDFFLNQKTPFLLILVGDVENLNYYTVPTEKIRLKQYKTLNSRKYPLMATFFRNN